MSDDNVQNIFEIDSFSADVSYALDEECWIRVTQLPEDLKIYGRTNFDKLFSLHPEERAKVVMYDKEIPCDRWQQSYLNTPVRNPEEKHSYMFSGLNESTNHNPLPVEFEPFKNFMDQNYNQVLVNWYESGKDFIPYHTDYETGMKETSTIAVITLTKDDTRDRTFIIKPKQKTRESKSNYYDIVKIRASHGSIIIMGGKIQQKYVHGVPKVVDYVKGQPPMIAKTPPRISISFRDFC